MIVTLPPIAEPMCLSVSLCLSVCVCLSMIMFSELHVQSSQIFVHVTYDQWCIGGYTRVYGVYQPPGVFLTAYTHLSDHK